MSGSARAQGGRELVTSAVAMPLDQAGMAAGGDSVAEELAGLGYAVVSTARPAGLFRAASLLAGSSALVPIYRYRPALIPSDRYYPEQFHHVVIGSPAAWDITRGSFTMPIAILDTGVSPTHPDLRSKILPGWNFHDHTTNTADPHGHGTAVAGAAAACGDNVDGVAGVAWYNPILPVRIAAADGFARSDALAAGIRWAADHGARIINVSYGPLQGDSLVAAAARYARQRGALTFAAAGNDGTRWSAPADPSILFVAATDRSDTRAFFSAFGPTIRLAAPGVNIASTTVQGSYASFSGTSLACPIAAGVAALAWSVNPGLTADQIETILLNTARDLGVRGRDELYGAGRVDAAAAVRAVLATRTASPTPTPTPAPTPTPRPTPAPTPAPAPTPTPTPSIPVPVTPRPSPAPTAPLLAIVSPGPNGYWFGSALTLSWQAAAATSFVQVNALVDGSLRATAPRTLGSMRGTFSIPTFPALTRGRHVIQLLGLARDGREYRSAVVDVLRP